MKSGRKWYHTGKSYPNQLQEHCHAVISISSTRLNAQEVDNAVNNTLKEVSAPATISAG
jgi:hypothetical protein